MWWKIYAVLSVIGLPFGTIDLFTDLYGMSAINKIIFILMIPSVLGLFAYAFDINALSSVFWRPYSRFLIGLSVLSMGVSVIELGPAALHGEEWEEQFGSILVLVTNPVFLYLSWLAVHRYAAMCAHAETVALAARQRPEF